MSTFLLFSEKEQDKQHILLSHRITIISVIKSISLLSLVHSSPNSLTHSKTLNINTMRYEDQCFKAPFVIKAFRSDFIYAFSTYFTVSFPETGLQLSTSPYSTQTHWHQVMFYLNEPLTIDVGETIEGEYSLKFNALNPRFLDISISYHFRGLFHEQSDTINYKMQ